MSLHHLKICTPGKEDELYSITDTKCNRDIELKFNGTPRNLFYRKINPNSLVKVFQWEYLCNINNTNQSLHLLIFHEINLEEN